MWHGCARQVAELTRILEEDELFKYPEKDDVIGTVRAPSRANRTRCCPVLISKPYENLFGRLAGEIRGTGRLEEAETGRSRFAEARCKSGRFLLRVVGHLELKIVYIGAPQHRATVCAQMLPAAKNLCCWKQLFPASRIFAAGNWRQAIKALAPEQGQLMWPQCLNGDAPVRAAGLGGWG